MPGCAKAVVAKCKALGVVLTGAGATYPYGKDPLDSNIRIAPSFPTPEEMEARIRAEILAEQEGKKGRRGVRAGKG